MKKKGSAPKALVLPVAPVQVTGRWLLAGAAVAVVLSLAAGYLLPTRGGPGERSTVLQVDDTRVLVVDNFFPEALANEWRAKLRREWEAGRWFFTTNNNGHRDDGNMNQKVVSRRNVEERQVGAEGLCGRRVVLTARSGWQRRCGARGPLRIASGSWSATTACTRSCWPSSSGRPPAPAWPRCSAPPAAWPRA